MNKVSKTCGGFDICIMGHAGRTAECPEWRPKWIPVSEEMPEQYETVIGWAGIQGMGEVFCTGESFLWCSEESHGFAPITHWMPLPDPPKEVIDIEQIEVE